MTPRPTTLEEQWLSEGFSIWPTPGRFVLSLARIFFKPNGEHLTFRVIVTAGHCNGLDIAHGGFISTLADSWLACNVAHLLPEETRFVTASLSVDFLRPVKAGAWLESEIDRIKLGSRLCHASGAILSDGQPIAAMRAVFAVLG
ncbi:MAG: PaaI family thioesterase [Sulfuricaulis sp.]